MRNSSVSMVIETCMSTAGSLPLDRRALLYRGLAEICGCPQQESTFLQLAENLESAHEQLLRITGELFEYSHPSQ